MQTYYIEIKMLIWTNFTTALKPLKVIPQKMVVLIHIKQNLH